MIVVSDSSPLISLVAVGHLNLLRSLFTTVLIPDAVYHEVAEQGMDRTGAHEIQAANWIEHCTVENKLLVRTLTASLDSGEAEAISLALERGADLVLLDEQRGRRQAEDFGLAVTGTLGILVEAKRQSLLAEVRPVLEALRTEAGFWMSDALHQLVLDLVDESS